MNDLTVIRARELSLLMGFSESTARRKIREVRDALGIKPYANVNWGQYKKIHNIL